MERRILVLVTKLERGDELIAVSKRLAKRLDAGVTLLYVKEERLFELPIYEGKEQDLETAREELQKALEKAGCGDWALLLADNDIADHALLESEREHSVLIISDEHEELGDLLHRSERPLYRVKSGAIHEIGEILMAVDVAGSPESCLNWAQELFPGAKIRCYMDYQFLPDADEALIDPFLGTVTVDTVEADMEVMEARKKSFERFCREQNLEGTFAVGEKGLEEDILDQVDLHGCHLLLLSVEDSDTLLGDAARHLIEKSPVDTLVCYNAPMLKEKTE